MASKYGTRSVRKLVFATLKKHKYTPDFLHNDPEFKEILAIGFYRTPLAFMLDWKEVRT